MGHWVGQGIAQWSAVALRQQRVLAPSEQVADRVSRPKRTVCGGRDDLADGGTEECVTDVDTRQWYAVGLAADQSAQPREHEEVPVPDEDLTRTGGGERLLHDREVLGPGQPLRVVGQQDLARR